MKGFLTNFITSPHRKIGKERKIAKTDRKFKYFRVVRKSTIGEEMGKKRGAGEETSKRVIKVQNPYDISMNRLVRKDIISCHS